MSKNESELPEIYVDGSQPRGLDGFESYLKEDWDGEGAAAISERTLKNATNFLRILPAKLPPVDACPGVDGSIGFEWETSVAYFKLQGVQKDKAVIPAPFIAKSLYERLRSAFGALGGEITFSDTV
jgi:hypothetical protein